MAVLLQDDYNRANSTTVPGAPQVGPTPTALSGVWGITANALYSPTVGILSYELGTVDVDYRSVIIGNAPFNIITHITNATNFWLAQWSTSPGFFYRCNNGQFLAVAQLPPVVLGNTVRTVYRDGLFRFYLNDVEVLYYELPVDMRPTATAHGMRTTATTQRFDNVLIQDAPSNPPSSVGSSIAPSVVGGAENIRDSFVYRGRDTKIQDNGGVA